MPAEIWVDAVGTFGMFEVSNIGSIRRKGRKQNRKLSYDGHGYLKTAGRLNGKKFDIRVSRVVAFSFLGGDIGDKKLFVCHKNDVRDDNRLENLFIGTPKENTQDAIRKGRHNSCWNKKIKN